MGQKNQLLSITTVGGQMIVSAIFKAIAFYVLFITIRGAIRAYGNYSKIKDQIKNAQRQQAGGFGQHAQYSEAGAQTKTSHAGGDVIEADYKVID